MEMFEVGGCVRDELLGVASKDIDFTVVLSPEDLMPRRTKAGKLVQDAPFDVMANELRRRGFEIFLESPQFLTVRAQFPKMANVALVGRERRGLTADFVLARKEGTYTDGRRPDAVEVGTLLDDLARRDFTVNAMAKDVNGDVVDPFGGRADLEAGVLRAVGSAEARLREDALRALRALRFMLTKGFTPDDDLMLALRSEWLPELLGTVSVERRRDELFKMTKHSPMATMDLLWSLPAAFRDALFAGGLWFKPTLEDR